MSQTNRFFTTVAVTVFFCCITALSAYAGGILYVKPTGRGDGSSWENAMRDPQEAIDTAAFDSEITQVWVARGTYVPSGHPYGNFRARDKHFGLRNGVSVYGGFSGTETELSQRNFEANPTIFSGDIGEEGGEPGNILAYHVFYHPESANLDETAVLDGITITGGRADGSDHRFYGGGMYNDRSSPTLINVTITGNYTSYHGGGMYNASSNPTLTNVTISGNWAGSRGGGMYNASSNPILNNVTISNNTYHGMYNSSSNPILNNVTVSDNTSDGMHNSSSNPTLTHVTISDNTGHGMYNYSSNPTLTHVTISNNIAGYANGGGMHNVYSSPILTHVTINNNTAPHGGGIYNGYSSNPTLTNVTISNNTASEGGGIYNDSGANATLINCTVTRNIAVYGGGIYSEGNGPVIKNSIFWNNTATENGNEYIFTGTSRPNVSWSIIAGGYRAGTNILRDDPRLRPLFDNGGFTRTHAIPSDSPAYAITREAGDGPDDWNGAPDTDQRGIPRATTGFRAMGAFEGGIHVGNLQVTIEPEDAVTAGAQWRRAGMDTWYNSEHIESDLLPGDYALEFKALTGWTRPTDQTVSIIVGETTSVTGRYTVVTHTVTATADSNGTVTPQTEEVIHGETFDFTVTPNTGYIHSTTGGTCPAGTFDGNIYTTGAITRSCSIQFTFSAQQHTVSATAGDGGTVSPAERTVSYGNLASFTVTPDTGYIHGPVGGTCPAGTFSGNTYSTGEIITDCSVSFSFALLTHTVSVSADPTGTVTPLRAVVNHGETFDFTVIPNSGYTHGTTSGTCPAGTFDGNIYTTGAITQDCSIRFTFSMQRHTVRATAGDGGTVSPAERTVSYGGAASFTVTPDTGYVHGPIGGTCPDGSFNGNTYSTGAIIADCSVSFSFTLLQHTVSAAAGDNGSVSPTSQPVTHGEAASFTVTPHSGYVHGNVGGTCPAGAFSSNTYTTGAITEPCSITFSFTQTRYLISASAGNGGSVTPTSIWAGHGSAAAFTVTPHSGFAHGLVGGTCPAGSFSGNTYHTGAITAGCNVSFSFTQTRYTVSANAGSGGSVTPTSLEVGHGAPASFTVTPDIGFAHGHIGGSCPLGSFSGNTYTTGAVTGNCAISFSFTQSHHTVNASAGDGGSVMPTVLTVGHNGAASFTVTPHAGYVHHRAEGSCPEGSFSGSTYTTGAITADCHVNFVFTQNRHTVTATAGEGGSVSPTSLQAGHGASAGFTVIPDVGYHHSTVGGSCPPGSFNGNVYTTGAITQSCAISFNFIPQQYTVTATAGPGGSVSPTTRAVSAGHSATFTVIPETGHTHARTGGTCPAGSFDDDTYTTGVITGDCTVAFSFRPASPSRQSLLPGVLMLLLDEE